MCGIIGYAGKKTAAPIVLQGLKRLEYRGYDSVGIASINGSGVICKKGAGKIDDVHAKMRLDDLEGTLCIGHTRWATHGGVTDENSHPHFSCDNRIAVAHNGIIENYLTLKNELIAEGHVFRSQTDTEVIPHLLEKLVKQGLQLPEAAQKVGELIEGRNTFLAIMDGDNRLVAFRRGSPLVAGIGAGEYFLASDIPAFMEYTKDVVYLYDDDVVVVDGEFKVFNKGKRVERPVDTISWSVEQVQKGNFDHYMMKEIAEQAETIQRAIAQDPQVVMQIADQIKRANKVFIVACGSAGYACLAGSYFLAKIAKVHAVPVIASEFRNYVNFLDKDSLVLAVSQSGETADVLEAVNASKERSAMVISIVNVMGSSLMRSSDKSLLANAGPEFCVATTKAYTAQMAIMPLLAYACAGKFEEGKNKLKGIYNDVYNLTSASTRRHIHDLAERLRYAEHMYIIGRDVNWATAMEATLKIKEIAYIHAEAFAGAELKHGVIALIEKGTPCIVFVSQDNAKETMSNAIELKARGGWIIGVGSERHPEFDYWIKVPEAGDLNPILQTIPMQILGYELGVVRQCEIDKPRNLAKSVTVK
ncbi:glutamine--fructose-6-phosphate transaminase (isomerizing) [Candidatus Micrarchaeota archaeon]|nr:glutamine--fructose-6-phosphate transaminase (isomerizing) [Candidatus Micrarchaeota archaeon]